jgi:hypothetical protein
MTELHPGEWKFFKEADGTWALYADDVRYRDGFPSADAAFQWLRKTVPAGFIARFSHEAELNMTGTEDE